jgi:aspartyl-tRNA(Asn)/glutamyl-tRNA(Gln) amidotransferase subunit A
LAFPSTIATAAIALRSGTVSSAELVETSLAAIDRHQASTNAFITVDVKGARNAARRADQERRGGQDRGPLHGVPISLKDLIDVKGIVTTAGSHVLDDRVAPVDSTVAARLRAAGAIVIGRTNLHEFAFGTTSEDSAFGAVHHPRDAARSAGGSSGGSAAAVATGMGLASVGTDTGGSVRIPSACCGLVGLKPSPGDIPTDGVIPLSWSLDSVGPITRTVEDAALLFSVLSARSPVALVQTSPSGLRFRRLSGYFSSPLQPEVRQPFDRATTRLAEAGATLVDGEVADTARIATVYVNIVLPEAAAWHASTIDLWPDRYTPPVLARLQSGRAILAVDYIQALEARTTLRAAVDAALEGCDALILPTLPIVAPTLGEADVVVDPETGARLPIRTAMLKHTQLFNLTGHPAITLPLSTGNGWPVGLQIVGRLGETDRLLEIAAACEKIVA